MKSYCTAIIVHSVYCYIALRLFKVHQKSHSAQNNVKNNATTGILHINNTFQPLL